MYRPLPIAPLGWAALERTDLACVASSRASTFLDESDKLLNRVELLELEVWLDSDDDD